MQKTTLAAALLLFFNNNVAFAGGDHGSTFQTAGIISNGVIAGRIGNAGDVDYFKVVVGSTSNVNFLTTGDSDTIGALFNSSFSPVAFNDDANGSQNFRIAQELMPGTYYLTVKLYSPSLTGSYDLRVVGINSTGPTPPPRDDHANNTAGATALAPNGSSSGILTAGDVDYFSINVQQAGRLLVRSTGNTDAFGTLISPSGPDVTNDDTNGQNFELSKSVLAGRYFVGVRHYQAATGAGNYGISATFTPAVALTPPSLIAPLNTTVSKDGGSNFSWSSIAGATGYRLVISQSESFAGYSASTGTCSNSTCAVFTSSSPSYFKSSFNVAGQLYFWRVQALNGSSSGGWSRNGSFTTTQAASPIVHPLPSGRLLANNRCRIGTPCAVNSFHRGIDLMAPAGTSVRAMCNGTVERNETYKSVWNSVLVVRHTCNSRTYYGYYGHIQSNLAAGVAVAAGQALGTVKNDGSNSHLHMGMSISNYTSSWGYGSNQGDFFSFLTLLP